MKSVKRNHSKHRVSKKHGGAWFFKSPEQTEYEEMFYKLNELEYIKNAKQYLNECKNDPNKTENECYKDGLTMLKQYLDVENEVGQQRRAKYLREHKIVELEKKERQNERELAGPLQEKSIGGKKYKSKRKTLKKTLHKRK